MAQAMPSCTLQEKDFAMHSTTRHGRLLYSIVFCGLSGGFAGCAQWATYPPVETKAARMMTRAETAEPLPTIMALAIDYVRDEYLPGQNLPVNLPTGTSWEAYNKTFSRVKDGKGGTTINPMTKPGEPAICITEVRTRAFDAEVDVIYPRADGLNQLATLKLQREVFKEWAVKSARPWQIRNVQLPDPTYVAPPVAEPNTTQPAAASQPAG